MDQSWNKDLSLESDIVKQSEKIKPIDILVGVLCKDVETTILNVLNVINEGLYRYFPDNKLAIVTSDGNSTDKTRSIIDLFQPYSNINLIKTNDVANIGKGAGVLTIFEIAHLCNAKSIVLIDGDLLSVKPIWIQTIVNPIVYGRADLTVPYYIRDKYDGVITNNLVYPFTRALYGIDIRQPIAGEYALSKNLYELLRKHPLFPPDFGIDIFILTVAAAKGFYIKEGLFSLKIHESTTRYLEPEKFLIPMFRKVTSSMFTLAKYYEKYWKIRPNIWRTKYHRESFSKKPIPVQINLNDMAKSYKNEFKKNYQSIKNILPIDLMSNITNITEKNLEFNSELWVKIVYNYAAKYKKIDEKDEELKYELLDTLKTLWIGRFVSYAKQVENMDINEAEKIIQQQAEIFEKNFEYLKSLY